MVFLGGTVLANVLEDPQHGQRWLTREEWAEEGERALEKFSDLSA